MGPLEQEYDNGMADVSFSEMRIVFVEAGDAGARLDKWLAAALPELSRSRLKALIEAGVVGLRTPAGDTVVTDPAYRIREGQTVRVALPEAEPALPEPQAIALNVVYEDDFLIVIDKPAGLVVHPAPGNPDATLVNALLAHCAGGLSGIGGVKRPGIVHRLDKDTSGLMVAAKTDAAHHGLSVQFAEHTIERAYQAVVWGVPRPQEGTIEGRIGRSPIHRKKMAVVSHGGKSAMTRYQVLKCFGVDAALVECRLATGRTHQIRVHMSGIGHPLVGDSTYGANRRSCRRASSPSREELLVTFPRQALHAFVIGFRHPVNGQRLVFESQLSSDINLLVSSLEQK
ncbi:MAG: RluA family pseudouridine synthase [Alphaproteobacteria bacterium]